MPREFNVTRPEEFLQGLQHSIFGVNETAAIALVRLITAIARFGEGVGTEANERLRLHQFFDDGRIVDVVNVINDLSALVANPTVMFELCRTMHAAIVDGDPSSLASLRLTN